MASFITIVPMVGCDAFFLDALLLLPLLLLPLTSRKSGKVPEVAPPRPAITRAAAGPTTGIIAAADAAAGLTGLLGASVAMPVRCREVGGAVLFTGELDLCRRRAADGDTAAARSA